MRLVKLNESTGAKKIFYFIAQDTNRTALTSLSGSAIALHKGSTAEVVGAGTLAHCGQGLWSYVPASGELDTLGQLIIRVTATGMVTAFCMAMVVAFDPYDSTNGILGLSIPKASDYTAERAANLDNVSGDSLELAATGLDAVLIDGITLPNILAAMAAVLLGVVSGANGANISFRKVVDDPAVTIADSDVRVLSQTDQYGNRTAVGLNLD